MAPARITEYVKEKPLWTSVNRQERQADYDSHLGRIGALSLQSDAQERIVGSTFDTHRHRASCGRFTFQQGESVRVVKAIEER